MKEIILITGANGLVAKKLAAQLQVKYDIRYLTRKKQHPNEFEWDITRNYMEAGALVGVHHIIHLAGAGIADKSWTKERKKEIIDSRVDTAKLLLHHAQKNQIHLKSFISASGVSYYDLPDATHLFTEKDSKGSGFLSDVTVAWENAADMFTDTASRVVKIRTGIVLSTEGGILPKISAPIRWHLGAILGNGQQYLPWIHIEDLCNIYTFAIENVITGAFNAVAEEQVSNRQFTIILAKILKKWIFKPKIPRGWIKLILGERATLLLQGNKISNQKIRESGFQFRYSTLLGALNHLFKQEK